MIARLALAAVVGLAALSAHAQQVLLLPRPRPTPMPTPVVAQPLQVRGHTLTVTIDGPVATTRIEQTLYNPNPAVAEGTLLLPLPKEAHVDKFTLDIAGNDTEAELLDAEKARSIYEEIVRKTRDPALLEYVDGQLLQARVFPIEAHAEKRLTLTYSHVMPTDGGVTRYVYPILGRTVDGADVPTLALKATLRSRNGIANVYSPTHEIEVSRESERSVTVGFETNRTNQREFQLLFSMRREREDVGLDVLTYRRPGEDRGYFAVFATPSVVAAAPPLPKDLVFVVDTSGSMAGEKLEQAKRAIRFCLASLEPSDRIQLIRFSTEAKPLFEGLVPANKDNVERAEAFVETFKATGGTAISDALSLALGAAPSHGEPDGTGRMRAVMFLTDGQPTLGETNPDAIVKSVADDKTPFRVFCFGIGTDINTHLLDRIAEARRAATEYVLPDEDIEVKVSRFYEKVAEPAMTDLTLSVWPVGGVRYPAPPTLEDLHPRPFPDLFKGQQLVIVGRYSHHRTLAFVLEGMIAGEKASPRREAVLPGDDDDASEYAFIASLWATRQVGFLLNEIRLRGDNDELRDEVVRLAREFGIVTPYTSHLIVEDEMRRNVAVSRRSFQLPDSDAAQLGEYYRAAQREESGAVAVAGAAEAERLRGSSSPATSATQPSTGLRYAAKADRRFVGLDQNAVFTQQVRKVSDRVFVQNGRSWTDTRAQNIASNTASLRVRFASAEYFQLLRDHPETASWLSLGRNVQFVLGEQIVEIVDES